MMMCLVSLAWIVVIQSEPSPPDVTTVGLFSPSTGTLDAAAVASGEGAGLPGARLASHADNERTQEIIPMGLIIFAPLFSVKVTV